MGHERTDLLTYLLTDNSCRYTVKRYAFHNHRCHGFFLRPRNLVSNLHRIQSDKLGSFQSWAYGKL
jgi:hypothetical protein